MTLPPSSPPPVAEGSRPTGSRDRRKILLIQPSLQPPGGGNGVAAWLLQSLVGHYDLGLLHWHPLDLEEVNRHYGTHLEPGDFETVQPPPWARAAINAAPAPLSHLKMAVMVRHFRHRLTGYDLAITANNETDFGGAGIQYIHYPWAIRPRPKVDLRWYHLPPLVDLYYHLCDRVSPFTPEGVRANLTLTNSKWTAGRIDETHGFSAEVLYPPVVGDFPSIPWEDREDGFAVIGRLAPEKELPKVVRIIEGIRRRGHRVKLHIIGAPNNRGTTTWVREAARRHPDWLFLHEDLPRPALLDLVAGQRYGIHGMREEHFGMAVAELRQAGCVPFVADGGGSEEIVDRDLRLIYHSEEDAIDKIDRVLGSPELRGELRADLAKGSHRFAVGAFAERFKTMVDRMLTQGS